MTIIYRLGDKLYINLTNRCTNDCKFCVRRFKDGVGPYNLWIEEEPSAEDVLNEIAKEDLSQISQFVFCGYGEPLMRLEELVEISNYLKDKYSEILIRINTNGQANLIYSRNILLELKDSIDIISISLNSSDAKSYQEICKSKFGLGAFPAIIDFIELSKEYIPTVILSTVDYPGVDIRGCKEIAKRYSLKLKVRDF